MLYSKRITAVLAVLFCIMFSIQIKTNEKIGNRLRNLRHSCCLLKTTEFKPLITILFKRYHVKMQKKLYYLIRLYILF